MYEDNFQNKKRKQISSRRNCFGRPMREQAKEETIPCGNEGMPWTCKGKRGNQIFAHEYVIFNREEKTTF